MVNLLWLLLIPYLSEAYGIHGGEAAIGTPRIIRNLLCAWPFALVAFLIAGHCTPHLVEQSSISALFFVAAYLGTSMGFDNHPLWFKGLVTLFPVGAALLPLAYWIGYRTPSKNVLAEYLSGLFYGAALAIAAMVFA